MLNKDKIPLIMIGFALGFMLNVVVRFIDDGRIANNELAKSKQHIKVVMMVDRNCNDCHLGESFINLFTHKAVNGNDNVAMSMMDKAHIKRW
jgi:hypothetical protein